MNNKQIKEMMRDIDPKYQQKADARAVFVKTAPRRNLMPTLLVSGAALGCAAFAAAVLLPSMNREQIETAASQADMVQESGLESEIVEIPAEAPITDFSNDSVLLMTPAYAPYALTLSTEAQQSLSAALMCAEWIPCDMDAPYADGETYMVFVYNNGNSYSLTEYGDGTVLLNQNGTESRWKLSEDAACAITKAAHPADDETIEGHLIWCADNTINAADIWKNTRAGAKVCDMTNKQDIFFKMNNTVDYFDRCSAKVQVCVGFSLSEYEFQVDLNTAKAYQNEVYWEGSNLDALLNGGASESNKQPGGIISIDGEYIYTINTNNTYEKWEDVAHRIDSPTVPYEELYCTNPEIDNYDFWNHRGQLLSGISIDCIENYRRTVEYLKDFDKWDIVGTDQVNGRVCVQIEGTTSFYWAPDEELHFVWFVDEATGVTVRLLGYDSNNTLVEYIDVTDLAFDDDAEPVKTPDYASMKENKIEPPTMAVEWNYADPNAYPEAFPADLKAEILEWVNQEEAAEVSIFDIPKEMKDRVHAWLAEEVSASDDPVQEPAAEQP